MVIGCKNVSGGNIRYCKDCLRAPHLSEKCKDLLDSHYTVSAFVDQYLYVEINSDMQEIWRPHL